MHRRAVLGAAGAAVLAGIAPAFGTAGADFSAHAERGEEGLIRLTWTNAPGRAAVFVSSDPDAPAQAMRRLALPVAGDGVEAGLPVSPRPYFLVRAGGAEVRVAERLLPLRGGRNFRDLGGYRGAQGRQVRWGRLFRSGVTASLTPEDLAYLRGLGLRVVCDLRSSRERAREPAPFSTAAGDPLVAALDYEFNPGELARLFSAATPGEAAAVLAEGYVNTAVRLAPQFRDLFQRLLRQETPLAFNCSAGKDRTGMAAALILSVLGVSRADVVRDYALSERFLPVETFIAALQGSGEGLSVLGADDRALFARMPEDVVRVIMGAPAQVMEQTLARLDDQHGGPIGFAARHLEVDEAARQALQRLYLV